jgi:hypothetical protein
LVRLEVSVSSVDWNTGWASKDGSLEGAVASGWKGGKGSNSNESLWGVSTARSSLSNVWVVSLKFLFVAFEVFESPDLKTSIASTGLCIAIDKVRFGKLDKVVSLEEMGTFKSSGGGESPAWSALSLVLDWVNGSISSPVNGISIWDRSLDGDLLQVSSVEVLASSEPLASLTLSHGREHVVSSNPGVLWVGVDVLDDGLSLDEKVKSELVLLVGGVTQSLLGHVCKELSLDVNLGGKHIYYLIIIKLTYVLVK